MTTWTMLFLIVGCAIVTWLPRVLPFIIVKNVTLPPLFLRWLRYIPICILSALIFETLFVKEEAYVALNGLNVLAAIVTSAVAIYTKSLYKTVLFGVFFVACMRLIA